MTKCTLGFMKTSNAHFYLLCPRYLTPPPTSTDVERLFSRAGAALPNHRAGTLPERVDRVLFIRENILSLNFVLDWD